MSACKTLIVYDNLTMERVELKHPTTGEVSVHFLKPGDEEKKNLYVDEDSGLDMTEVAREPLVEWFAENYKNYGATLEFITDKSQARCARLKNLCSTCYLLGVVVVVVVVFVVVCGAIAPWKVVASRPCCMLLLTYCVVTVVVVARCVRPFARPLARPSVLQEGNQFCKGFGGVGAILQWKVDFMSMDHTLHQHDAEEQEATVDDFDFDEYDAAMDYEDDFI